MRCGLLGKKLIHSYSPTIHKMLGDYSYELFEKNEDELEDFVNSIRAASIDAIDGINVTIPYKKMVIPYLDELSPEAEATGSVNTIIKKRSALGSESVSKLIGYNTDTYGFKKTLERYDIEVSGKKVLVLGNGGAAASVKCVLEEEGARVVTICRTGNDNFENISGHYDADVIVNATPVGMYPRVGESIINLEDFGELTAVIDLIYNPARTKFLLDAEKFNVKAVDGLYMLVAQAAKSYELFQGSEGECCIEEVYRAASFASKNIILIGMPGVGKTTEGIKIARESGRDFFDSDEEFKKVYGISPADVISADGEEKMREMETLVLKSLGAKSGAVISTGGGCVTVSENYNALHQNGIIVWLDSPLESLETSGRPLSTPENLEAMYRNRKELYASWADIKLTYGKDDISYESISDKWSEY